MDSDTTQSTQQKGSLPDQQPPSYTESGCSGPGYSSSYPQNQPPSAISYPPHTNMYNSTNPGHVQAVTVVQAQPNYTHPVHAVVIAGSDVPDYMCLSIITTLFFCLCLGIFGIVYSSQANSTKYVDPARARELANKARIMNLVGIIIGFCMIMSLIIVYT